MIEKRYYAHKHLLHENEVHDKRCHRFMGLDETVEHMNNEYWKYKQLKNENEQLKEERDYFERKKCEYFNKYNKKHLDNIQLKEEIKYLNDILARNEDEYVEENIGYYMTKGSGLND